jgi:hypothetical protein
VCAAEALGTLEATASRIVEKIVMRKATAYLKPKGLGDRSMLLKLASGIGSGSEEGRRARARKVKTILFEFQSCGKTATYWFRAIRTNTWMIEKKDLSFLVFLPSRHISDEETKMTNGAPNRVARSPRNCGMAYVGKPIWSQRLHSRACPSGHLEGRQEISCQQNDGESDDFIGH